MSSISPQNIQVRDVANADISTRITDQIKRNLDVLNADFESNADYNASQNIGIKNIDKTIKKERKKQKSEAQVNEK